MGRNNRPSRIRPLPIAGALRKILNLILKEAISRQRGCSDEYLGSLRKFKIKSRNEISSRRAVQTELYAYQHPPMAR